MRLLSSTNTLNNLPTLSNILLPQNHLSKIFSNFGFCTANHLSNTDINITCFKSTSFMFQGILDAVVFNVSLSSICNTSERWTLQSIMISSGLTWGSSSTSLPLISPGILLFLSARGWNTIQQNLQRQEEEICFLTHRFTRVVFHQQARRPLTERRRGWHFCQKTWSAPDLMTARVTISFGNTAKCHDGGGVWRRGGLSWLRESCTIWCW